MALARLQLSSRSPASNIKFLAGILIEFPTNLITSSFKCAEDLGLKAESRNATPLILEAAVPVRLGSNLERRKMGGKIPFHSPFSPQTTRALGVSSGFRQILTKLLRFIIAVYVPVAPLI